MRDRCESSSPDQNIASDDDDGSLYKKRRFGHTDTMDVDTQYKSHIRQQEGG